MRALRGFESHMSENVLDFKRAMDKILGKESVATLDISPWGQFSIDSHHTHVSVLTDLTASFLAFDVIGSSNPFLLSAPRH